MPVTSGWTLSPPPRERREGKRRKLCETTHKPQLPLPRILMTATNAWNLLWSKFKDKLEDIWDHMYIVLGAYYAMYYWSDDDHAPLLEWVRSKAPGCSVSDFSNSWKNGVILVALLEGIVPNTCGCAQYHLLNPKHNVQNVELAFSMAKNYLGIYPTLCPLQVTTCEPKQESKLIRYILMLKLAMSRRRMQALQMIPATAPTDEDPLFHNQPCLAKGMGLMVARTNKQARFNLYVKHCDTMDFIIEIRGPGADFCSRRITNRSPRHFKISTVTAPPPSPTDGTSTPVMNIPLEYEIIGRKVSITYVPQSAGNHLLSIFWHGRHLEGSPYTVTVDESTEIAEIPIKKPRFLAPLKHLGVSSDDSSSGQLLNLARESIQLQTEDGVCKVGRVVRRRVLRETVLRNGTEIELKVGEPLPTDKKAWCSGYTCFLTDSAPHLPDPQTPSSCFLKPIRCLRKENSMDLGDDPIVFDLTTNAQHEPLVVPDLQPEDDDTKSTTEELKSQESPVSDIVSSDTQDFRNGVVPDINIEVSTEEESIEIAREGPPDSILYECPLHDHDLDMVDISDVSSEMDNSSILDSSAHDSTSSQSERGPAPENASGLHLVNQRSPVPVEHFLIKTYQSPGWVSPLNEHEVQQNHLPGQDSPTVGILIQEWEHKITS